MNKLVALRSQTSAIGLDGRKGEKASASSAQSSVATALDDARKSWIAGSVPTALRSALQGQVSPSCQNEDIDGQRTSLLDGCEWNVRLSTIDNTPILAKFQTTFDQYYWDEGDFEPYDKERFEKAVEYRREDLDALAQVTTLRAYPHQQQVLDALQEERAQGSGSPAARCSRSRLSDSKRAGPKNRCDS